MILVDTSAWIEFLRNTGSSTCNEVDRLLDSELATSEPVRMEVLAGATSESHLRQLRGLLGRCSLVPVISQDYDTAAAIYRGCRSQGATVRKMVDCLIAAIAMRRGMPLLHSDRDFDSIARSFELAVHPPAKPN